MSDTFVVIEEPAPNVVIVEQTVGGVLVTQTATPANVIEVTPPPSTVIVEGEGVPNVVIIAPASVSAGVATFDGRPGTVTFELSDAELIFSANGQLLVGTGDGTGELLDPTTDGFVLTLVGGAPAWAASSGGGGSFPDFAGSGSPEGSQAAAVGKSYVDSTNGALYFKLSGSGDTGWTIAGGYSPDDDSGSAISGYGLINDIGVSPVVLSDGTGGNWVSISDTVAWAGSGTGIYYVPTGTDGEQTVQFYLGPAGTYEWTFGNDGTTTIPGPLNIDYRVDGGAATVFAFSGGDPNGSLSALAVGDICIDTFTPALWQATNSGDSDWVVVSGAIPFTADGQLWVGTGSGTATTLDPSTDGYVLTLAGGVPAWLALGGGPGSFPDFSGSGSPEGVITATTFGQWYEDVSGSTGGLYVYQGPGGTNTGWASVGGSFSDDTPGLKTGGGATAMVVDVNQIAGITDVGAMAGSGNGIYYYGDTDGSQYIQIVLGASGADIYQIYDTVFRTPGPIEIDTTVHGGSSTIFASTGNPGGSVFAGQAGDICIDSGTPALWQSTGSGTSSWVNVAGGGASFPDFTGDGSPEGVVTGAPGQWYQDTSPTNSNGLYVQANTSSADTGWMQVGGYTSATFDAGTRVGGLTFYDTVPLLLAPSGETVGIMDVPALGGTGNGLYFNSPGTDGDQYITIQLGSTGQYEWVLNADGTTDFPGGIVFPAGGGNAVVVSAFDGDPNGSVIADERGDFVFDQATPAIWQATGSGTSSWVNITGTGNPFTAAGDLWIGTGTGTGTTLGVGSNGEVLTVVSGSPAWAAGGGGGSFPDLSGSGSPVGVESATAGQWYEDTSGSTSGIYTKVTDVIANAYFYGDVIPTFPVTVATGVNDEFVYTPIATGIPETFTVAAGTYSNQYDLTNAVAAAIGSGSGEAWSTISQFEFTGSRAFMNAPNPPTLPLTVVTSVNDTFIYTPIATGSPETFTLAAGTYSTLGDLTFAIYSSIGSMSGEQFHTKIGMSNASGHFQPQALAPGTYANGDTLTTGPTDVLADLGFTSPATLAGGTDGVALNQLNVEGAAHNGDTITFGANDVAADLGFTGDPDTFEHGFGEENNGWMQVGGYAPSGMAQYGLSAPEFTAGQLWLLSLGGDLVISDVGAQGGGLSGNGLYWNANETDGEQSFTIQLGSGTVYDTFFNADGSTNFPGPVQFDYDVGGGGAYFHSYLGNPNGHISANDTGDICVDTSTPAIWQSTSSGDSSWVEVTGGAGGSFPNLTGSGSPVGSVSASAGQWYQDTHGSTSGLYVYQNVTIGGDALCFADAAPTLPLIVVTGTNDEFVYTPNSTGIPETFTMAAGTYNTLGEVTSAVNAALGVSSETFDSIAFASLTQDWTPASASATSAPSIPFTVTTGVNDTFIYTPATTATPETFTVAAGTYADQSDLADAVAAATGTGSDTFNDWIYSYDDSPGIGTSWFTIFSYDNVDGDTLTTGPTDILAGLGFASPTTFTGGSAGVLYLQADNEGAVFNGDSISAGANDVSAAIGFTGNPDYFEGGSGEASDGWMQVGGNSSNPTWGISGNDGTLNLLSFNQTLYLGDVLGKNGSGNGLHWFANGEDFTQELDLVVQGPSPTFPYAEMYLSTYGPSPSLYLNQPISYQVSNVVGAPYVMTGQETVIISDNTVQLPEPYFAYGCQFIIKDSGAGTMSVLPFASELIDGGSSFPVGAPYEGITVINDGTNWWIIGAAI